MAVEIELKAWADKPEQTREILSRIARYAGEFLKEDAYWHLPQGSAPSLRIRHEARSAPQESPGDLVTFKTKNVREGIEVNREIEFRVSSRAAFEEFLGFLGLEPAAAKRKRGARWDYPGSPGEEPVTVELLEVEGLGWFLELEIIAGDDDPETVKAARKRLFALLEEAGIAEDRLETRYYTEMLRGKLR
ncbi:MAG: class IV adenylate cyclase [Spirochaetaceae bacterium]|nr:class IV adenylate cyclase [Spirochaetaceae bacterium]